MQNVKSLFIQSAVNQADWGTSKRHGVTQGGSEAGVTQAGSLFSSLSLQPHSCHTKVSIAKSRFAVVPLGYPSCLCADQSPKLCRFAFSHGWSHTGTFYQRYKGAPPISITVPQYRDTHRPCKERVRHAACSPHLPDSAVDLHMAATVQQVRAGQEEVRGVVHLVQPKKGKSAHHNSQTRSICFVLCL